MEKTKNNRTNNVVQVSFSAGFLERLDIAVDKKRKRNRQDLIRRAVEDEVDRILAEAVENR